MIKRMLSEVKLNPKGLGSIPDKVMFFGKVFFKIRAQPLTAHDASLATSHNTPEWTYHP